MRILNFKSVGEEMELLVRSEWRLWVAGVVDNQDVLRMAGCEFTTVVVCRSWELAVEVEAREES